MKRPIKHEIPRIANPALNLWKIRTRQVRMGIKRYTVKKQCTVPGKDGKPKGLIATSTNGKGALHWLYYPKKEHIPSFIKNAENLTSDHPQGNFPGAAGAIRLFKKHRFSDTIRKGEHFQDMPNWLIDYMQGFFTPSLDRKIAREHGGWREHLLRELFKQAHRKASVSIKVFGSGNAYIYAEGKKKERLLKSKDTQLRIFVKIAQESGFTVKQNENGFLIAYEKPRH